MFDCTPLPVGKERLVVGDITMMGVKCFGKLSLLMHCPGGDTNVRLMNVAYVPGVQFNLFPLHAVMSKCRVTMDTKGVHMLGGSVLFVRRETGSYCSATRITDPPMANTVLVPGKQQRIDINDPHVALAHLLAKTLRVTARQHGVEVVGELVLLCWALRTQGEEDACSSFYQQSLDQTLIASVCRPVWKARHVV